VSDLQRAVEEAQSILTTPAAAEARRCELALARASRHAAEAMARLDPSLGAGVLEVGGGLAIYAGLGNPLTQCLGLGLDGPVTASDLLVMEAQLGAGDKRLEVCPYVDPSLPVLLAERGYRVHEWQLVWTRAVPDEPLPPPPPGIELERAHPGQEDLFSRTLLAGFMETEDVPAQAIAQVRPLTFAAQHELWIAWMGGEAIGAATFAWADGVIFGGSGVRPAFRRRGTQGALIRKRLDRARELGCDLACSNTLPGTASRRNMERNGYHVAYPKLGMLKTA
jgi:GNAT superfamily N-acetyltransferase